MNRLLSSCAYFTTNFIKKQASRLVEEVIARRRVFHHFKRFLRILNDSIETQISFINRMKFPEYFFSKPRVDRTPKLLAHHNHGDCARDFLGLDKREYFKSLIKRTQTAGEKHIGTRGV